MLCVPSASVLVAHCAVREVPDPASATAEQPLMEFPPSMKLTDPVGEAPVTVAVNVTTAPWVAGLAELESVVVLAALVTTCDSAELVEATLLASPPYAAVMLWVPMARVVVAHWAVRMLPVP